MLDLTTIGLFAGAAFMLSLIPGPDMIYIATRSVSQGRNAGVASVLGVYTGVLIHLFAAAIGLSALIAASAVAFNLLKYVGAGYLIYLGIQTFFSKSEMFAIKNAKKAKLSDIFYQGLLINTLNPKVVLFFLAFFPQFIVPSRGDVTLQFVLLGALFIVITLPVNIVVSLAGGQLGTWLRAKRGVQRASKWVTGSIYILLGITTALTGSRKT